MSLRSNLAVMKYIWQQRSNPLLARVFQEATIGHTPLALYAGHIRQAFCRPQYPENMRAHLYFPFLDRKPVIPSDSLKAAQILESHAASIEEEVSRYNESWYLDRNIDAVCKQGSWTKIPFHSYTYTHTSSDAFPRIREVLTELAPYRASSIGSCYLSRMGPKTEVKGHFGPTNARIRIHLCLECEGDAWIQVGDGAYRWTVGRAFCFNDAYWHSVSVSLKRTILLFDVYHPDLTMAEREFLEGMHRVTAAFHPKGLVGWRQS